MRRNAGLERRLPRGRLADSALDDVAHDDFFDVGRRNLRSGTAARIAIAPSSGAESGARPPRNRPIGVLAAETITGCRLRSDIRGKLIGRLCIFPGMASRPGERAKSGRQRP